MKQKRRRCDKVKAALWELRVLKFFGRFSDNLFTEAQRELA